MTIVTVRAPAKINLDLRVGPVGDDGYHPVATVYQAIALYDEIKARPAEPGEFTVTVTGEGHDVLPLDDSNIAVGAARALAAKHGVDEGVALSIHKTIAVAGGLAGGSADAAGALVACDALWGTRAAREELAAIASDLGSDVPFCLVGGNAVGTARGDQLSPVLGRGMYQWVLAYADDGLSTADVYREYDRLANSPPREPKLSDDLLAALRSGDPYIVGAAMHNDLQAAALRLRPSLARTLGVGADADALASMVSGSGPTVLFLAADDDHAVDIAVALSGSGTCRTVQRAHGPVPGARVVG
ncbi:MAG TPA: 4-(cytidine 5'-diphospho)-2-C-methyl-D-erythritol kinase [Nocardioidaceae bacterium]|nr:4-(cytidine 5'-diphospho)-2-C-methyl-D-erythritol kinase [Nocardioidaceae bacterium]